MGYSRRALEGASWNSIVKVGATTVLSAAKLFVLVRILTKEDLGLFALVLVSVGIVESLTETGVNATIIQSPKSVSYFLDTAWVISIVRGLLISIVMILAAFIMRSVYQSQELFFLIGLASFVPVIKGFINPAIVSYQKELQFVPDSFYRLALVVVEVIATVVLAFALQSAVGLVFGLIVSALFEVALTFWLFYERPRFQYISSRAQEIFHNMRGLNLLAVLSYLVENIDSIVVGKVIGTAGLGVYQNTYSLTHRLNHQLAKSVQHATYPVYSKIGDDSRRLKRAFVKTLTFSLIGFCLIGLPFFIFPGLTIGVFFGESWAEAVPLVRPLLVAGVLQSVVSISAALCVSKKTYSWLNANLFVTTVVAAGGIVLLGQQYGLVGAVSAVALARLVGLPFVLFGAYMALVTPVKVAHWRDRI